MNTAKAPLFLPRYCAAGSRGGGHLSELSNVYIKSSSVTHGAQGLDGWTAPAQEAVRAARAF